MTLPIDQIKRQLAEVVERETKHTSLLLALEGQIARATNKITAQWGIHRSARKQLAVMRKRKNISLAGFSAAKKLLHGATAAIDASTSEISECKQKVKETTKEMKKVLAMKRVYEKQVPTTGCVFLEFERK